MRFSYQTPSALGSTLVTGLSIISSYLLHANALDYKLAQISAAGMVEWLVAESAGRLVRAGKAGR